MIAKSSDSLYDLSRVLSGVLVRLRQKDLDPASEITPYSARTDIIRSALASIHPGFDTVAKIITVRVRSGYRSTFLRPIYSYPTSVGTFSHDIDSGDENEFDFTVSAFGPKPIAAGQVETANIAMGAFASKHRSTGSKSHKTFLDHAPAFLDRIHEAHKKGHRFDRSLRIDNKGKWREEGSCFIFGKVRAPGGSIPQKKRSLEQMVAVYVLDGPKAERIKEDIQENRSRVGEIINLMFESLDDVGRHERDDFQRDALRKIASLVLNFTDPETPPAEDVGALLEAIAELFRDHPSIGPYLRFHQSDKRRRSGDANCDQSKNWIRFITIKFAQDREDAQRFEPTFAIYPKAWARMNYVGSYLVAHRDRRSTVKFLTYLYLKEEGRFENGKFPLGRKFAEPFEEIEDKYCNADMLRTICYDTRKGEKSRRCIVLTQSDGDLWKALHREHSASRAEGEGEQTKTTAAFLLTRRTSLSSAGTSKAEELPYAALVFESAALDAFSDADLELLSILVDACAPLIASLKLGGTEIDYANKIKSAYANYNAGTGQEFGGVMFELLRLDRFALQAILDTDEDSPVWIGVDSDRHMDRKTARELIGGPLRNMPLTPEEWTYLKKNDPNRFESSSRYEREIDRIDWLGANREMLEELWRHELGRVGPFLEAVPSNDMWHCYLSVIPRALADRGADAVRLSFSLLDPGYGASAMFVVGIDSEISQVLKLSRESKIKLEQKAYTRYVRFCVPLAAHLPAGEIPIENTGAKGEPGFGVLISDLIGERASRDTRGNRPLSFLDACRRLVLERSESATGLREALQYHFETNVILWTEPSPRLRTALSEWSHASHTGSAILQVARIEKDPPGPDLRQRFSEFYPERLKAIALQQPDNAKSPKDERADILVAKMLSVCEQYYNQMVSSSAHVDIPDEKDGLSKHLIAILRKFNEGVSRLPNPGSIRPAIIHGDLNCRNLTWSDDYKKFFIIDFEYVHPGFYGADQLKLMMSLIAEFVPSMLREGHSHPESVRKVHQAAIRLVQYVSNLAEAIQPYAPKKISDLPVADNDELGKVIHQLISLIEMDPKENNSSAQFWHYALSSFAMREFELSLNSLPSVHLEDLQDGTSLIAKELENPTLGFQSLSSSPFSTWGAARLFYSYLALLATLKKSAKPNAR